MPKCSHCEEEFKILESWGNLSLCPMCVDKYNLEWGKKPKNSRNITIERPSIGEDASYNPGTGAIELKKYTGFNDLFKIINHEYVHFIIHKLTTLRATFQYDAICKEIDPYHSLR